MEEPPVAVRGLRAGEPVPTPQPAGPAKGVVSLEAGKCLTETKQAIGITLFLTENRFPNKKTAAVESLLQNYAPAQRFPSGDLPICNCLHLTTHRRLVEANVPATGSKMQIQETSPVSEIGEDRIREAFVYAASGILGDQVKSGHT